MIAPLIKPIRLQGGTFYTFSSASEDLGLTFNNSQKKFKFSKFALLNIPDIKNPTLGENFIGLSNSPGAFAEIDGSKTVNDYFAESFQNYCLNLEAIIASDESYDPTVDRTVSERVFFKWLKETGAMRFREATVGEISSTIYGIRWVEEAESSSYKRVVKYVGDINILNSVRNNFNAFSEVYIYIPTSHGNTPTVLFDAIADANYGPNRVFTNTPANPLAAEYLFGRDAATQQPAGLSTFAFYDSDGFTFTVSDPFGVTADFYSYDVNTASYIQEGLPGFQWWYSNPIANTYFLEPAAFGDATNDQLKIESINKAVEFKRSRLDGISLEFQPQVYAGINNVATGLTDFGKFNETAAAQSFEFNAVLIYYDLYDPANPSNSTTNLFGVLILDNVDPLPAGGGIIPRFTKYKPNSLTGDNGNSYAFRINLKFDVNTQDTAVETSINDYNPFSLQLYMEALNEMNQAVTILLDNNQLVNDLQAKFSELQDYILTDVSAEELKLKVAELEDSITDNAAIFANTTNILNLIQRNYQEITNIYQNKTSVEMSYNLDILSPGQGIFLDKTSSGGVKIVNTNQQFNLGTKPLVSILGDFSANPTNYGYVTGLRDFTNYLKITDGSPNNPQIVDRDVIIYIDDTVKAWEKGQVYRIAFTNGIDLDNTNGKFNFIIYSDAKDTLNTGFPYSAEIGFVTYLDFERKGNSPIIELVCIDPSTYQFSVDIF
jgi:hypothetical protein